MQPALQHEPRRFRGVSGQSFGGFVLFLDGFRGGGPSPQIPHISLVAVFFAVGRPVRGCGCGVDGVSIWVAGEGVAETEAEPWRPVHRIFVPDGKYRT